jgi:Bacterial Ig-like domain (group 3)
MSEKIYTHLLRLYPSRFRKKYEAEVIQFIRDRYCNERGFLKRARLSWDLVVDVFAGLPSAYRNSYAVAEPAPLSINASSIPSFKILDEERLGRGPILIGSTISVIVLVAFPSLLSQPIANRPLPGSHELLSPIEAVMQRLNQGPSPDPPTSSSPETAMPALVQMRGSQAQPSTPGTSSPTVSASSSETEIPSSERNRIISAKMLNPNEHSFDRRNAPKVPAAFAKVENQTGFSNTQQRLANRQIADVPNSSHDPQIVVQQSPGFLTTVAKVTPTVALSYLPAKPIPGSMVNLTVTVLGDGTGPTPTGNVRFFDGSAVLNTGKLSNGTVTVKGKVPYIATHSLSVIYYGDASYSSASSIRGRE